MLDGNQLASSCFTEELGDPWMKLTNDETHGDTIINGKELGIN